MKARLFSKTGALAGIEFFFENEALIGRDGRCDLVLYPQTVSVRHARIYAADDQSGYWIEDLGSSNGTSVDRTEVNEPMRLDRLHVITLASDIDLIFQVLPSGFATPAHTSGRSSTPSGEHTETTLDDAFVPPPSILPRPSVQPGAMTNLSGDFDMPDIPLGPPPSERSDAPPPASGRPAPPRPTPPKSATPPPKPATPPPKPAPPKSATPPPNPATPSPVTPRLATPTPPASPRQAAPAATTFTLVVETSKHPEMRFVLKPGENVLGRSTSCDISIPDQYLSGRHAAILVQGQKLVIRDLDSSNRTFVNEVPIETDVEIKPGTPLRFGPLTRAVVRS